MSSAEGQNDAIGPTTDIAPDWFWGEQRAISHSPFGRKVLVLAIAQGMFSAGSNATTRVHHTGWRRGGRMAALRSRTAANDTRDRISQQQLAR
jgi:hypothetical protein